MMTDVTQRPFARDRHAHRFPVSIKGVVLLDGQVALLKNGRDEWELPGGKLEVGERPEDCLRREIAEELGLEILVGPLLDTWLYHIYDGLDVFVVTYGCVAQGNQVLSRSDEHQEAKLFSVDEVWALRLPEGYRLSITDWSLR
jgi:8-oxo-dGTP pyrophosphatase MutT (NUDIX family)